MLSKNKIKLIQSLQLKKFRDESQLFIAEGEKLVFDLSKGFDIDCLILTEKHAERKDLPKSKERIICSEEEMKKASRQKQPQGIMALLKMKETITEIDYLHNIVLVLDGIQDPGNLGTIIRLADWFGIKQIVCSNDTADHYSSKVVQSTMGALARVEVSNTDLIQFIDKIDSKTAIYGTLLDGKNIYEQELSKSGLIVMGNEGKGISEALKQYITKPLFIPNYPIESESSESLNVATATAIVCAEFRRRS